MPGSFSFNILNSFVSVTGGTELAPATFSDLYAADLAGELTLDDARAISSNPTSYSLTYQPMPAEQSAIDLVISASANKVGAQITIAGTDCGGDAIAEVLDISMAFSSPVTTRLKYRTVNSSGITVSGISDGTTITIKQMRWGVIGKAGGLGSVAGAWRIYTRSGSQMLIYIGDGLNSTYFKSSNESISFERGFFQIQDLATLQSGELDSTGEYGIRGSHWYIGTSGNTFVVGLYQNARLKFYGSSFKFLYYTGSGARRVYFGGPLDIRDSIISQGDNSTTTGLISIQTYATGTIKRTYFNDVHLLSIGPSVSTASFSYLDNILVAQSYYEFAVVSNVSQTCKKWMGVPYFSSNTLGKTVTVVDPILPASAFIGYSAGTLQIKYTTNVKVVDQNGTGLVGATVVCKRANGTEAFNAETGVGGSITEQQVIVRESPGAAFQDYGPFTFTISLTDYQTLTVPATVIDQPLDLTFKLYGPIQHTIDGKTYFKDDTP